jgi:uncharacterized C2H2 Zn-finger protein
LGGSFQTDTLSLHPPNSGESAMNTKKPLWMNEPDADQTSIRFSCPYCHTWIRRQEFEKHVQEQHQLEHTDKLKAMQAETR